MITAMAIAELVAEGKLELNRPVFGYRGLLRVRKLVKKENSRQDANLVAMSLPSHGN